MYVCTLMFIAGLYVCTLMFIAGLYVCILMFIAGLYVCTLMFIAGVEEAFYHSSRVMTVSFHKHSPGFFPGQHYIELDFF